VRPDTRAIAGLRCTAILHCQEVDGQDDRVAELTGDIDGSLSQGATVLIELGGTFIDVPADLTSYDRIDVTGTVELLESGTVVLSFIADLMPSLGDFFDVIAGVNIGVSELFPELDINVHILTSFEH